MPTQGFVGSSSFWLLLGLALLAASGAGLVRRLRFLAGAARVTATVVRRAAGPRRRMIVRLDDGTEVPVVGVRRARPVGTTLEVLANPDQPGHVLRPGQWQAGGGFVAGMIASMVLLGVGLMTR